MTPRALMLFPTVALAAAIAIAACSSSTPSASGGAPPVALPSIALPSVALPSLPAVPSFAIPSLGTSQLCAGKPTFSASAQPSFPNDPDLAAKFPQQIAGAAPDQVQTFKFVDELCLFGGIGLDQMVTAFSQAGVDITSASIGSATYSLPQPCTSGESPCLSTEKLNLTALRTPGGDATKMVTGLAAFTAILGQQNKLQNIQQSTVGGKSVFTAKQGDGKTSYVYPAGDTLWLFDSANDQTAATVLSAFS
jgi:hypothetical protein